MRHLGESLILCLLLLGACAPAPARPPGGEPPSRPAAPASAPAPPSSAPTAPATGQLEWQAVWDQTLAAARQEGKVVIYGPPGERIRRNLTEGFQKAFPGVALELMGGRCAELTARIEAERRAGLQAVDVFLCGTTTANSDMKPAGVLAPIPPVLILPEATDPSAWLGNRLEFSDSEGQFNLVYATTPKAHVAYDLRQVKPEDVDELPKLLDPKWKGKIVVGDPVPTGAAQTTVRWMWAALGPEQGADYLRALRAQAGAIDRDARRMVEWVARGRYAILVGPNDAITQQLLTEGLSFGVLSDFKDHGAALSASYGSIMRMANGPHPNAATLFINWLLTKEGQTAYSTGVVQASRRLDVPTDHLPPENRLRPDGKYWAAYTEDNALVPPGLRELLRDTYGN